MSSTRQADNAAIDEQWRWTKDTRQVFSERASLLTLFSRTRKRVHAVGRGQDPLAIPSRGKSSKKDLLSIVNPGYGFFIARLRRKIRKSYNISGNVISDIVRGFLLPRDTLVHLENEIAMREQIRLKSLGFVSGASSLRSSAFVPSSPLASSPDLRSYALEGTDTDSITDSNSTDSTHVEETSLLNTQDMKEHVNSAPGSPINKLDTIQETESVTSTESVQPETPMNSTTGSHAIAQDEVVQQNTNTAESHDLRQDLHRKAGPTGSTGPHELRSDTWFSRWLWRPTHELRDDVNTGRGWHSPHKLHDDILTERTEQSLHKIDNDSYATRRSEPSHMLHDDAFLRRDVQQPHELRSDEYAQRGLQQPHMLQADHVIDFSGVSDRIRDHNLGDDDDGRRK